MRIRQLRQKLLFLPVFLAICGFIVYLGYFAPADSDWGSERDRREYRFIGPAITITTLLWFFFGSIEWSWPFERLNRDVDQDLNEKQVAAAEEGDH